MTEIDSPTITADMTMGEIQAKLPSAQRALFQRYHIGGCSSCAYESHQKLAEVCKDHNILDVKEVLTYLEEAQDLDDRMQLDPQVVKGWIDSGEDMRFLDARAEGERALAALPGAEVLDFNDSERYMQLPKETKLVFCCHDGGESLNVAAYFKGHGFANVFCVRGGLEAWRRDIDPSIPTYERPLI